MESLLVWNMRNFASLLWRELIRAPEMRAVRIRRINLSTKRIQCAKFRAAVDDGRGQDFDTFAATP